jgi:hypothetical protein
VPNIYSLALPITRHGYLDGESPLKIDPASPLELRRAVERLARYFKKELGFDALQFEAAETQNSLGFVPYEAYLFYETAFERIVEDELPPRRIFGAGETSGRPAENSAIFASTRRVMASRVSLVPLPM